MTQNGKMENSPGKSSRSSKKKKNKSREEEERKRQEERRQREARREEERRAKEQRKKDEEEKRQREIKKKAEEERKLKEQRRLEDELRRTRLSQRRQTKATPVTRRYADTSPAGGSSPGPAPHAPLGASASAPGQRHSLAAPGAAPGPGSLQRSASFIKRALEELGEKVLRRSLSFAGDLSRPAGRDVRRSPWTASLTSLQEDAPASPTGGGGADAPDFTPGDDEQVVLRRSKSTLTHRAAAAAAARHAHTSASASVAALDAVGPFARTQSLLVTGRHASALDVQGLSTFSRRRVSSQGGGSPSASSPSGQLDAPALPGAASAGSLPWLHKFPHEEHALEHPR